MKVLDLQQQNNANAGIVAFGFFDAIHVGHQRVIGAAVDLARQYGVPASVFMFKNNIFPLIGIDKTPLYSFKERVELIERLDVDQIFYVDADESFLSMTAEDFLDYLSQRLAIVGFTCGYDFTFGKDAKGTSYDLLMRFGTISEVVGSETVIEWWAGPEKEIYDSQEIVSTDLVKKTLEEGDVFKTMECLRRPYSIKRVVRAGRQDGSKMGFPTINFDFGDLILKRGVYFTNVVLNGVRFPSVSNVGGHPTFADEQENIETYILDFDRDLYDREVELQFLCFHREIRSFASQEELIRQIESDVEARRAFR